MKTYFKCFCGLFVLFATISACSVHENYPEPVAISQEPAPPETEEASFSGTLRSVSGVMDKLSCYTSYGGYITLKNGSSIPVSFENDGDMPACTKIKVVGHYIEKAIDQGPASPCPVGTMRYFVVESFECLDR